MPLILNISVHTSRLTRLILLLEVLQGGLHLQALLQVVERRILQATIADQVVELMAGFNDIQIQNVV